MWIYREDMEKIIKYLRKNGETTAKELIEQLNLTRYSPKGVSQYLADVNEIIRLTNCRPYKFKAIAKEDIKEFTGEWEKKKNIISFKFKNSEATLDYDFNTNDFVNYDCNKKYLNANDFINCFLRHRPVTKIEWLYNYKDILGNDWSMYRLENIEDYMTCPKGFIKWVQDNNSYIFGDNAMEKFLREQQMKSYLNDRQYENLKKSNDRVTDIILRLLTKIGTVALTKIMVNSVKEYDIKGINQIESLLDYCNKLDDYSIDTNRTLSYNLENKKRLCDLKENKILAEKLQTLNFLNDLILDDYIIKVPQNILDLQNEGQQQNNCVGYFYNESVKKDINLIYFLRHKETPNVSCVTCRYNRNHKKTEEHRTKNNHDTNAIQETIIEQIDKLINKKLYEVG